MDIIILIVSLLLVIGTVGAWVYVFWWSRQPKRPARSWTLNWSMVGIALLVVAVVMSLAGALWLQPQLARSFMPAEDAARAMDSARACLLIPGVIVGVLGLASLGIARRPEGRKFTARELGAVAIFMFGLMITGEGIAFVTSRAILPSEVSANPALDRLLPGIVIMLVGVGIWRVAGQASRQAEVKAQPSVTEPPPPWSIATAAGMIIGYFAVVYAVGLLVMVIVFLFIPQQEQDVFVELAVRGTFTGVTNGLGDLAALAAIYGIIRFLARGGSETLSLLGLRRVSSDWLITASAGAVSLMVLFELSALWLKALPVPKIYLRMFNSPADWIVMILFVLLLAPLTEEVLHRGVFYPAVAGRYGAWAGVIASSLVYGGIYVITYASDWAALARTFAMGMLYTSLRAGSKSIWPGVLAFTLMDAYLIARTAMLLR